VHQLRVAFHRSRPEPPLKEMALPAIAAVEGLRIQTVHPAHARAEIGLWRLDQQVHVVAHEAVRQTPPPLSPDSLREQLEIELPIGVVVVDHLAPVPAREHVMDPARDLLPGFPRHATSRTHAANLAPR
jgi:hypothetical protein